MTGKAKFPSNISLYVHLSIKAEQIYTKTWKQVNLTLTLTLTLTPNRNLKLIICTIYVNAAI